MPYDCVSYPVNTSCMIDISPKVVFMLQFACNFGMVLFSTKKLKTTVQKMEQSFPCKFGRNVQENSKGIPQKGCHDME